MQLKTEQLCSEGFWFMYQYSLLPHRQPEMTYGHHRTLVVLATAVRGFIGPVSFSAENGARLILAWVFSSKRSIFNCASL